MESISQRGIPGKGETVAPGGELYTDIDQITRLRVSVVADGCGFSDISIPRKKH